MSNPEIKQGVDYIIEFNFTGHYYPKNQEYKVFVNDYNCDMSYFRQEVELDSPYSVYGKLVKYSSVISEKRDANKMTVKMRWTNDGYVVFNYNALEQEGFNEKF